MRQHVIRYSRHTLVATGVFILLTLLTIAGGMGLFLWKVSHRPVAIGWAKDYVEHALSDEDANLRVAFDDMVFTWPDLKGPFQLDLTGLRVTQGEGESNTLSVREASIGLSRGALLFGRVRPVSVSIDAPALELVRARDGHISLLYDNKEVKSAQAPAERPAPGAEIAQIFKDMALHRRGRFFSRLDNFKITNAAVAVRDHQFGLSWYLTGLNFTIGETPGGVAATVDVPLPGGREQGARLALNMLYRKKSDSFAAQAKIRDVNPYVISRFLPVPDWLAGQDLYFTGDLGAALDTNLIPQAARFSGAIPEGVINVPDEFDAPVALKDIRIDSTYSAAENKLAITNLSGSIGGIGFQGMGEAVEQGDKVTIPIRMAVEVAQLAQVPPLFPKSEQDGQAYAWLAEKISAGTFQDVALNMTLAATKTRDEQKSRDEWSIDLPEMVLDFGFTGASVQYHETLARAENASGTGRLDLGKEVLTISGGAASIGDLSGTDISVEVTDLMTSGAGFVTVGAKVKGPMGSALNYIAAPPIGMDKERIGLDPAKVKGDFAAEIGVALPTVHDVPKDQVKVEVKGTMSALELPAVVAGATLTGGPLNLATEEGGFRVTGDARLEGQPVTLDWHQYFDSEGRDYSMRIKAKADADQNLRNKFGVNLDDYISGTLPVDVLYTRQANGDAVVEVKGDLAPARLWIEPFKYEKPVGVPGDLSLTARLEQDVLKELTGVNLKTRDFTVPNATIGFAPRGDKKADLDRGKLPGVTLGKTKADVSFDVDKSGAMAIKANASVFDLAPFLQETETSKLNAKAAAPVKEKRQPMKITLAAPRMLAKNDQEARATKSYLETDADGDITRIEYDATIGKGKLSVRFRPETTGQRTFRLTTNDAGAVLYTFGLYENLVGGDLVIYGEPKGGDQRGNLYGSMRMENFRVVKAPALASLLSLMSLSGVGDVLRNQGLVFSKLESGFEWRFREAGNLLIIKDGTTSGNSIGLTFSGVLDRGKKTTDIAGTIIPISGINRFLGKIPLVGGILGGASGLIAATYSMKGPTSDPQVSVNPLSVLAPGIIRRILFEGGYESKIPDDLEKSKPAPAAKTSGIAKPSSQLKTKPAAKAKAANN